MRNLLCLCLLSLGLGSCTSVLYGPEKERFDEDIYTCYKDKVKQGRYYLYPVGDSVRYYAIQPKPGKGIPRPVAVLENAVHLHTPSPVRQPMRTYYSRSLDVDLFTAPIKYRPPTPEYPHQLQPVVNVNVYVGYRVDRFRYRYNRTPAGFYERDFTHYGLSAGAFMGSGSEHIYPGALRNQGPQDYEGWVWSKGVGLFLGVQNVTIGLLAGTDQLIDRNRMLWVYHERLWVGLGLGLNLN